MGRNSRRKKQRYLTKFASLGASKPVNKINWSEISFYIGTIFIIGIIVYSKVFSNYFVWDDLQQLAENQKTFIIANIPIIFTQGFDFTYRPIFFSIISIINTLFGFIPAPFHSLSIILHLLNDVLVFLFLTKFFNKKLSFFIALLFLVHPMNVEPVANISFMMELGYFFFGMSALLVISSFPNINFYKRFFFSMFLLLLSLLSKESGSIFIVIIGAYFLFFERKHLPKIITGLFITFCTYLFLRFIIADSYIVLNYIVPPYIPIQKLSLIDRLLNIPSILMYYIKTFFWPAALSVQQYWVVKATDIIEIALASAFILILVFCLYWLARKLKTKNELDYKYFKFFLLWFIVAIAFHLQIIPLTMTVADRWFYLPMVGILGVIVTFKSLLPSINNKIYLLIGIILLISLSVRSNVRTYNWQDNLTLYSHDNGVLQNNFSLENNLGAELLKSNKELAKTHIEKSIQLAPDWWLNWANLGNYYLLKHDFSNTEKYYNIALNNGKSAKIFQTYSKILLYEGSSQNILKSRKIAEQGIVYYPNDWSLWEVSALANYKLGNFDKGAYAAKQAYLLTNDKRYLALSEMIEKRVKFNIKGNMN